MSPAASDRPPDAPRTGPGAASFTDVDGTGQDPAALVAMMDATDAWPAVGVARRWALEAAGLRAGATVVDVGCGPGTFGALARAGLGGVRTIDVDRSGTMLRTVRDRHPATLICRGLVDAVPLADGRADLVHLERVLQWTADPHASLAEAYRLVVSGGLLAVTDTDWRTLAVAHPDPAVTGRLTAAAQGWVPHPALAGALAEGLRALGASAVEERRFRVELDTWDPDDPDQADGPPGLPLHSIAAAALDPSRRADDAVAAVADAARAGRFAATLELVTVVGRRRP